MRKPTLGSIGLAPEGVPSLLITGLATLTAAILGYLVFTVLFFLLFLFCCNFFRDPERIVPAGDGFAVSPADGRIVSIRSTPDPFSGEHRQCIGIFMNVFNVHVNRVPVECKIEDIRYFHGKFINAAWDKASTDNERCAYYLKDREGKDWTVVQIAGLLARRIVSHVDAGDALNIGQRFGMIKFGSRVDIYLPEDYAPVVAVGDRVFAGESIVAKKNEQSL